MSPPDDGDRKPSDSPLSDAPEDHPEGPPEDPPEGPPEDTPARETPDDSDPATAGGHPEEAESVASQEIGETDRDWPRRLDEDSSEKERGDREETEEEDREEAEEREDGTDWRVFVYDIVNSAVAVLLVGALLFAVSGVWPPMVAVESPSMTPQMKTGDLVFVMEETRFPGEGAHGETGVVTARVGETTDADYRKFERQGDVIVYNPDGRSDTTPIIHRAMFWVNESENWYDKADKQSLGRYSACGNSTDEALPNCPAPHAGFITKGDANGRYDQVDQLSGPVKPAWVVGTAEVRIPLLGCIRLRSDRCANGVLGTVTADAPPGCERCRVPASG